MKTTIEISDASLARAKRHARKAGKPLRALVEEGLRPSHGRRVAERARCTRGWLGAQPVRPGAVWEPVQSLDLGLHQRARR